MTHIYIKKVNDRNYSIDFTPDIRDFINSKPIGLKLALEVILPNRNNHSLRTVKNKISKVVNDKKILKKKRKIALASKN